jgi:hypothetical protein
MVIADKKAQSLTVGTIILMLLGVVVLVILIFGFTNGWSSLFDKVKIIGGGESNADTIASACQIACSTNAGNAYCVKVRKVNYEGKAWEEGSCKSLEGSSKIGLDDCSISCSSYTFPELINQDSVTCDSLKGGWIAIGDSCAEGKIDLTSKVDPDLRKSEQLCCKK